MKFTHPASRFLCLVCLVSLAWLGCGAALAQDTPPSLKDCDHHSTPFARTLQPAVSTNTVAAAHWMSRSLIRWPASTEAPSAGPAADPAADPTTTHYWLVHSARSQLQITVGQAMGGDDGRIALQAAPASLPAPLAQRFAFVAAGANLQLPQAAWAQVPELLRQQVMLVATNAQGQVQGATGLQMAGVLDDVYASAQSVTDLGLRVDARHAAFKLWAPTAQAVALCLYKTGDGPSRALVTLARDQRTGVWQAKQPAAVGGGYYTYLVDVFVPGVGRVRNRVTDPYATSLTTDSTRTWIGRLGSAVVTPSGWARTARPNTVQANTDLVIYELHVRDFSISDNSVKPEHRGKYLAFTETSAKGMQHLQALAQAGVTDVHLLPVFDIATVPEKGCTSPDPGSLSKLAPDSDQQQAWVTAGAAQDCFNWGYDPYHFTAPEGSYATNAADGAVRVMELRRMVQALHRAGLRVGMDMVYNHTSSAGQKERSVLDRIVPGYYHRLNAQGAVETSTCCDNTATENTMMGKLMIDSAVVWARDHHIDSMRFDLMGHQPRAVMEKLQLAVDQASGRHIHLIGEGWNFGEVADGKRFVQASQNSLSGSGIATFSDRGRDAVRGGGCCDDAAGTLQRQGWVNGQFYDANEHAAQAKLGNPQEQQLNLRRTADQVRVGLAGTLRDYRLTSHDGSTKALREIDYAGQGAGYASQPGEVVNYVENHDNPTLFDINVLKLPVGTSSTDRARVQVLALATTAFSQGIAYFHAGVEALRSKNMDRNSFDSGDWFNRLDWTFTDNHFGSGLPPKGENGGLWEVMKPLLRDTNIKPSARDIRFTRDAFLDLLKIRSSSSLFRLRTADDVAQRLTFYNTGPNQTPTVIVGHLDGRGLAGAGFAEVLYAINVGKEATQLSLPMLQNRRFVLHPVHLAAGAADARVAAQAKWGAAEGLLSVPARTALVFVAQ
jgi:pullulanase